MSASRAASRPYGRRFGRGACGRTDEGRAHAPPGWQDGTERPIHRPTDPEDQQDYDSGQQKGHTIKNLLVIDETCRRCFLRATYEGKAHDQSLAELEGSTLPHGSCLSQDMGFQGFILNGITTVQPQRNPRGGELTPPETATNRAISSISSRMEHAIGGVKRYRLVKDKIRLLKDGMRDTIMETCCGRHNFRLQDRSWHYAN